MVFERRDLACRSCQHHAGASAKREKTHRLASASSDPDLVFAAEAERSRVLGDFAQEQETLKWGHLAAVLVLFRTQEQEQAL